MQFIEAIDEYGMPMLIGVDDLETEAPSRDKKDKKKEDDDEVRDFNEWIKNGNQYFPAKNTKIRTALEPGYYSVLFANKQYSLVREDIETDQIYRLPNTLVDTVVDEIGKFWDKKELFKEYGITHKRGIILAGDPGNGKTSIVSQIAEDVIARGGIVFIIKNVNELDMYLNVVHTFIKDIEPDTPIVTVIEDIDSLVRQNESMLLNFLDGDDQFDHNVVVATTNRLQELNDLLLRPSRFDTILVIEAPDSKVREFFLTKKNLTEEEIAEWLPKTEGLSMAQLKEAFIAVKLLGRTLEEAINTINANYKQVSNKTFQTKAKSVGFGAK